MAFPEVTNAAYFAQVGRTEDPKYKGQKIGGTAVNKIEHWQFDTPHPDDELVKNASYETTSVYGFGHAAYYDNVIQTLRGEAQAQVDGYEGLRSLELLIACYRSARDGQRVGLPLVF